MIKSVSALTRGPFAYAENMGADGRYEGLLIAQDNSGSVIVHADVAKAQKDRDDPRATPVDQSEDTGHGGSMITDPDGREPASGDVEAPAAPTGSEDLPTSFYGLVELSVDRPAKDMTKIIEGIIEQIINMPDANVALRLEIDGEAPEGFDKIKQRTLLENAQTLAFKDKRLS